MPRQRALAAREDAARARIGVERASRYPDVTVGLNVGREGPADGRERVTTLTLSVPLPLFKRNDAAIGQAMSDATQAEIERAAAALQPWPLRSPRRARRRQELLGPRPPAARRA